MRKIRSVIIDDEPGNIVTLRELLKGYCTRVAVAGTASNPVEGLQLIESEKPEIVFLDIEMPYGNAFSMLDKFETISFEIIFITAFNEYAIKAFKYAALDYLLKPVSIPELVAAVERAAQRLEERNINTRIASLLANLKTEEKQTDKIGLPTKDGFHFEDVDNILFLEAQGSYTYIYLKSNVRDTVSRTLNYFEDILPPDSFCRVHHSYIININYVKKYYKGRGGYVEMENGSMIEISSRKKEDFLSKFIH